MLLLIHAFRNWLVRLCNRNETAYKIAAAVGTASAISILKDAIKSENDRLL